jgi:hypothetical protein
MGGGWFNQLSSLLGVGMLVLMLVMHVRRRTAFRRKGTDLRAVARELGLEHVPSAHSRAQGKLRGSYRGRKVVVDPDERRAVIVRFETQPRIDLRSYEISMPVPFDMVSVQSRAPAFNRFWKTRRASPAIAGELLERSSVEWIEPLRGRLARNVKSLIVTAEGVTCEVDFGNPAFIPADAVRQLLVACIELAEQFEPKAAAPIDESPSIAPAAEDSPAAKETPPATDTPPAADASRATDAPPAAREERSRAAALGWLARFASERFAIVLGAVALVALAVKLWLGATTYGTNDVYAMQRLATWFNYLGSGVYVHASEVQEPPLVLYVLGALDRLANATGVFFPFWLRLFPALADAGTLYLAYRLTEPRGDDWRTRWGLLILAGSPALWLISGFHGSTGSVMIFFSMLAVYLTEHRRSDVLAGLAAGVAASIQLVAILTLPVLFAYRPGRSRRIAFSVATLIALLWGYVPLASPVLKQALARVAGHQDPDGHWGLSWIGAQLFADDGGPNVFFRSAGPYLLGLVVVALALRMSRVSGQLPLYARLAAVFSVVLAFTSGFGVQALAWLAPWLVGLPVGVVLWHAVASVGFLLVVYDYWSEGLPWYLADSHRLGDYQGHADYFQVLCWVSVGLLLWCSWRRVEQRPLVPQIFDWVSPLQQRWAGVALMVAVAIPCAVQLKAHGNAGADRTITAVASIRAREYTDLSQVLLRQRRFDDGIEIARRATALDPRQAVAWNNLAAGYSSKSSWDAAIAAAEKALQLNPDFRLAANNLVWARAQKAKARNVRTSSQTTPVRAVGDSPP